MTRQSAVDPVHIRPRPSITIVSPDSLCIDILSPNHDTVTCPRAPLSPEIFITPQSSIESRYFVTPQTSFDARGELVDFVLRFKASDWSVCTLSFLSFLSLPKTTQP